MVKGNEAQRSWVGDQGWFFRCRAMVRLTWLPPGFRNNDKNILTENPDWCLHYSVPLVFRKTYNLSHSQFRVCVRYNIQCTLFSESLFYIPTFSHTFCLSFALSNISLAYTLTQLSIHINSFLLLICYVYHIRYHYNVKPYASSSTINQEKEILCWKSAW